MNPLTTSPNNNADYMSPLCFWTVSPFPIPFPTSSLWRRWEPLTVAFIFFMAQCAWGKAHDALCICCNRSQQSVFVFHGFRAASGLPPECPAQENSCHTQDLAAIVSERLPLADLSSLPALRNESGSTSALILYGAGELIFDLCLFSHSPWLTTVAERKM